MTAIKQTALVCHGHSRPIPELSFSEQTPDGIFLISACKDSKPMLRDGITGDWIGTFDGHKGAIWSAKLNKSATRAITGSGDFSAKIWDATAGAEMATLPHNHMVKSVCFDPDNKKIVTACNDKVIRLFDGNCLDTPLEFPKLTKPATVVLWGLTDDQILSAGEDGFIRIWDVRSGSQVQEVNIGAPITSLQKSRCGNLYTVVSKKKIGFYDTTNFELKNEIEGDTPFFTASINHDRTRVRAGGDDMAVHVYDYNTKEKIETNRGHHGTVYSIVHSPDDQIYASAGEDSTIRLWQNRPGVDYGLWRKAE